MELREVTQGGRQLGEIIVGYIKGLETSQRSYFFREVDDAVALRVSRRKN